MLSSLPPFSFLPQLPRQRISRVLARPRRHDLPVAVATPDHAAVWRHRDDVELMMLAWFLHAACSMISASMNGMSPLPGRRTFPASFIRSSFFSPSVSLPAIQLIAFERRHASLPAGSISMSADL